VYNVKIVDMQCPWFSISVCSKIGLCK